MPQPQTWMITITPAQGQNPATFSPSPLTGVSTADQVFWSNNDSAPHWPTLQGQPNNYWFEYQIPGKLPDQPAPTSPPINLASGTTTYVCAVDPQMAPGQIVVT